VICVVLVGNIVNQHYLSFIISRGRRGRHRMVVSFSPVSSTNKANRLDITELVLKVALNTTNHPPVIVNRVFLLFKGSQILV